MPPVPGAVQPGGQAATNVMMTSPGITGNPWQGTSGGLATSAPPGSVDYAAGGGMTPGYLGPPVSAGGGTDPTTGQPMPAQGSGDNSYLQPFTNWNERFQAPTNVTEQNDPGFQFRLQQGQDALQRSAAARGSLLTGGTAQDLAKFGQDYASNEYGNVYNRALNDYQQRYNIFQNNQNTEFNRLMALSGSGQAQTAQLYGAGTAAANNAGNIYMNSGQQIGNDYMNAGNAQAAGYRNSASAYGGMFSGLGNAAQQGTNWYYTNGPGKP